MFRPFATTLILLGCGLALSPAIASDRSCTPDIAWSDVPNTIRSKIAKTTGGEVSPQGGPFNSTDVLRGSAPQSRFFGACRTGKRWIIAVERGGRVYHLQVFKFYGSSMTDKWRAGVPDGGFSPQILVRSGPR